VTLLDALSLIFLMVSAVGGPSVSSRNSLEICAELTPLYKANWLIDLSPFALCNNWENSFLSKPVNGISSSQLPALSKINSQGKLIADIAFKQQLPGKKLVFLAKSVDVM
jgi:hypothetical protein